MTNHFKKAEKLAVQACLTSVFLCSTRAEGLLVSSGTLCTQKGTRSKFSVTLSWLGLVQRGIRGISKFLRKPQLSIAELYRSKLQILLISTFKLYHQGFQDASGFLRWKITEVDPYTSTNYLKENFTNRRYL